MSNSKNIFMIQYDDRVIQDAHEYLDYTEGFVPCDYFMAKRMMLAERNLELCPRAWYEAALLLGMEVRRV